VRPPEPERKVLGNANSKASQNASSAFGTPRYTAPPPQPLKRQPANALDSVAQNASSAFGTPRYSEPPAPGALLTQQGGGGQGTSKTFAPGEMLMPTPRSAADGAPRSRAAQQMSASLPGARYSKPEPQPPPPPKDNPRSTQEQQRSSLPMFGSPRFTEPPPPAAKGPAADASACTKAGRNNSSVFPGQTTHVAPPKPAKQPPAAAATTKAEQYASSVFGTPRHVAPTPAPKDASPREYTGLRLGPPKSASRAPPPQSLRGGGAPVLLDERGQPRGPQTKAEQQTSSVLGGTPTPAATAAQSAMRLDLSKSFLKVEFDGLPPNADSHRLHQIVSSVAAHATAKDGNEQGITCNRSKVKVEYGGLDGMATGKGSAQFRNVPDGDVLMSALSDAQARGAFGKGVKARLKFDDSVRAKSKLSASAATIRV